MVSFTAAYYFKYENGENGSVAIVRGKLGMCDIVF